LRGRCRGRPRAIDRETSEPNSERTVRTLIMEMVASCADLRRSYSSRNLQGVFRYTGGGRRRSGPCNEAGAMHPAIRVHNRPAINRLYARPTNPADILILGTRVGLPGMINVGGNKYADPSINLDPKLVIANHFPRHFAEENGPLSLETGGWCRQEVQARSFLPPCSISKKTCRGRSVAQ